MGATAPEEGSKMQGKAHLAGPPAIQVLASEHKVRASSFSGSPPGYNILEPPTMPESVNPDFNVQLCGDKSVKSGVRT